MFHHKTMVKHTVASPELELHLRCDSWQMAKQGGKCLI